MTNFEYYNSLKTKEEQSAFLATMGNNIYFNCEINIACYECRFYKQDNCREMQLIDWLNMEYEEENDEKGIENYGKDAR